ncbi:MAG: hypothetical protein WBJ37_00485 [Bacteroidales bacterium]
MIQIPEQENRTNRTLQLWSADIRFDTWDAGYIWHLSDNIKIMLYYEHPVNEKTNISGFTEDIRDDTFRVRLQYRFRAF